MVLVLLLVFVIQNTKSVKVPFFSVSGNMPLGVALLLAAVGASWLPGSLPRCASGSFVTGSTNHSQLTAKAL